jgi:hypothetical protein
VRPVTESDGPGLLQRLQQPVIKICTLLALALVVILSHLSACAQQPFSEQFRSHNAAMEKLQPAMITPLVAPDPRLIQYYRLSVAHQYATAGTETTSYGNTRGGGIIVANRFEFDWMPPPISSTTVQPSTVLEIRRSRPRSALLQATPRTATSMWPQFFPIALPPAAIRMARSPIRSLRHWPPTMPCAASVSSLH